MNVKLPTVVVVGRPNVGKSTLFNRMIGRRVAVVEDQPGVTRDRLYAEAEHYGKQFQIVDTGGILFMDDDPLVEQIRVQAEVALAEADVILFMVDINDGLSMGDMELANRLRSHRKPTYVVANKADNHTRRDLASEFYELGLGEVMPVSSLNGYGVGDLLDRIADHLPPASELEPKPEEIKLAIVGRPNVGKSSMLNAFTGEVRTIVSSIPGTTRDAIDSLVSYKGQAIRLIDTAGLRRRGKIQGTIEYYMALHTGVLVSGRYEYPMGRNKWFWEAGWGFNYSSRPTHDIESSFNSTPTVGVGAILGSGSRPTYLTLRLMHMSNAGLSRAHNKGQNMLQLMVGFRL